MVPFIVSPACRAVHGLREVRTKPVPLRQARTARMRQTTTLAVLATTTSCGATSYVPQNGECLWRRSGVLLHSPATCTSIDGDTSKLRSHEAVRQGHRSSRAAWARSTGGKGLRKHVREWRGAPRFRFSENGTSRGRGRGERRPQAARPPDWLASPLRSAGRWIRGLIPCLSTLNRHRTCRGRSARWLPKPLIGVNVDYRSARKDSPAFCFLHCRLLRFADQGRCGPHADSAAGRRRRLPARAGHVGRSAVHRRRPISTAAATATCSTRRCGCWIRAARTSTAG